MIELGGNPLISEPIELEGTWEEIVAHSTELAGRRVRLIVLPEAKSESNQAQPFRPSSGRLLRHAGAWAGDDFEECLGLVTQTRAPLEF